MRYERTEIYTVLCHTNYYGNGVLKTALKRQYACSQAIDISYSFSWTDTSNR